MSTMLTETTHFQATRMTESMTPFSTNDTSSIDRDLLDLLYSSGSHNDQSTLSDNDEESFVNPFNYESGDRDREQDLVDAKAPPLQTLGRARSITSSGSFDWGSLVRSALTSLGSIGSFGCPTAPNRRESVPLSDIEFQVNGQDIAVAPVATAAPPPVPFGKAHASVFAAITTNSPFYIPPIPKDLWKVYDFGSDVMPDLVLTNDSTDEEDEITGDVVEDICPHEFIAQQSPPPPSPHPELANGNAVGAGKQLTILKKARKRMNKAKRETSIATSVGSEGSSSSTDTSYSSDGSEYTPTTSKKRRAPVNKTKTTKRIRKEEPKVKNAVTPTQADVLLGRGGISNNWPGNNVYRKHVLHLQPQYKHLERVMKTEMANGVVKWVKAQNGRFLKRDSRDGPWYVIPDSAARLKVSQALREDHTPEGRAAKKARQTKKAT